MSGVHQQQLHRVRPQSSALSMPNLQPHVAPNPTDPTKLRGQTAIITGSTTGLGLETARQFLALGISTVILAVRNTAKGEEVKTSLLAGARSSTAEVRVMHLDLADPNSVVRFAARVRAEVPRLDILVLNAGMGFTEKFQLDVANDHEVITQVNFIADVLLFFELLPLLESGPGASRVTWVGSKMYRTSGLRGGKSESLQPSVLGWFDNPANFSKNGRYADTKLLAAAFFFKLAPRIASTKVVFNQMDPGMVVTDLFRGVKFPLTLILGLMVSVFARPVEHGGWLVVHSAAFAGAETHAKFVNDRTAQK